MYIDEKSAASVESALSLGSLSTSRFLLAHLAMLTGEHSAVDLSSLLTGGLMGLAQSVIRLAGESRWSVGGSGLFHSHCRCSYCCTVTLFPGFMVLVHVSAVESLWHDCYTYV